MNYDDLLPEEQNNPVLVKNLQSRFELKPEETQVLDHVHERLAHFSGTLPVASEKIHETRGRVLYLPQRVGFTNTYSEIGRKSFRLNVIAAVIIVGLLIGSLAFTFSAVHNRYTNSTATGAGTDTGRQIDLRMFLELVPKQTYPAPTQQALQATRDILYQRLVHDGFKDADVKLQVVNNRPQFEISLFVTTEVPSQTIHITPIPKMQNQDFPTLIKQGVIQFWGTGKQVLASGASFDPQKYTRYNPGGIPQFTGADLDTKSIAAAQDPYTGKFFINSPLQKDAAGRFEQYTANNIGNVLTVTMDGKVIESAIIQDEIKGQLQLVGDFTQAQAEALASVFKYGPLPLAFSNVPPYQFQLSVSPSKSK
jgi:hypothetical protein